MTKDFYESNKPSYATSAMPGSVEKINVLSERAERGEDLWHPGDRMFWDEVSHVGKLF